MFKIEVQQATLDALDRAVASAFFGMEGWCTVEKGQRMARLVIESCQDETYAPRCVELGVFGGRGVVAMGLALRFLRTKGGITYGRVEGIDPFTAGAALEGTNDQANADWWSRVDYEHILRGAQDAIRRQALAGFVSLIRKRSQDVVSEYVDLSIDVLHQDSNHSEEVTCYEVATWAPKIKPGGFWVFDDVNWPTTRLAQDRLITQRGFTKLEDHESWAVFQAPSK